jgi:GTP-binding protein
MRIPWSPTRYLGSFVEALPAPSLPEIAFAGRSNAGKSSALNVLVGSSVARTSKTPGRTQAINLFAVGPDSGSWIAADLPGYGYARVSQEQRESWRGMIEGYVVHRSSLKLIVALVDGRLPPQKADIQLFEWLGALKKPVLVLATKLDDLAKSKRTAQVASLSQGLSVHPDCILGFSSKEDINREEVRLRIARAVKAS